MIYLWISLLFLSNLLAWGSNFFGLPGNWLLLFFSVVYKVVLPKDYHPDLSTTILVMALIMAVFGEIWEFAASAAGATQNGGSRRGALYSILGSLIGSVGGAIAGSPVLVIGPLFGALVGGALGAFLGAYFGERNKGHSQRFKIGKAAMVGRLLGTAGKLLFGLVMLVMITADSFTS